MQYYKGPQPFDEKPLGGGRHNKDNLGHEAYNFSEQGGRLYGYFQWLGRGIKLHRIEPGFVGAQMEGVLVVFVANQRIVGWYRDAVIYSSPKEASPDVSAKRSGFHYICSAAATESVLLPVSERSFKVPGGKEVLSRSV